VCESLDIIGRMANQILRAGRSLFSAAFWFLLGLVMSTMTGFAWYAIGPVASGLYLLTLHPHLHALLRRKWSNVTVGVMMVALINVLSFRGAIKYQASEVANAKRAAASAQLAEDLERHAEERERQAEQSNEGLKKAIADLTERLARSRADNERLAKSNVRTEGALEENKKALAENKRNTDEIRLGVAKLSAPPGSRLIKVFEKNVELSQGKVTLRMHLVSARPKEWKFILDEFMVTACGHLELHDSQAVMSPGQPFPLVLAKDAALIVYVIALPNGTYVPWIGLVPPDPKLKEWSSPLTVNCRNDAFS
jgi:hypothetical protein